ncbi:MAG TPA: alpha/beta hydrolase [Ilumatobacter sp.]
MATASINGTTLHFEIDGDRAPCLVLHGGLGLDHIVYRRTLGRLADHLRLVFIDHRGNGRSGRPPLESITMEQLADDAVGVADHLGVGRFTVLGHSYGGFIAQELAIRHGARVGRLILVATTPGQLGSTEEPDDDEQGLPMPSDALEILQTPPRTDEEFEAAMARLLPFYFHRRSAADVAPLLAGSIYSAAAMARGFEILSGWSSVDRLATVSCPTLLIAGRHDVFTSFPQSHRIARRLPDAEVVVLDDSGHFPWIDEPEAFFAAVVDWLDRHAVSAIT